MDGRSKSVGATGRLAGGTARFRDQPRPGRQFIHHLGTKHEFRRVLLVSGDRENEVRYLADAVGITEVHAGQSPKQKMEIARRETASANMVFVGDGKEKPRGKPAAETWKPRGLPD